MLAAAPAFATNYECTPRDAFALADGVPARSAAATTLRGELQPLRIDTRSGWINLGLRPRQWTVRQTGNASTDFIAEGETPAQMIWVREWEKPVNFMLVYNSLTVVTGTCEPR